MHTRTWIVLAFVASVLHAATPAQALPVSTGRWDETNGVGFMSAINVVPDGTRIYTAGYFAPQVRVFSPAGVQIGSWGTTGSGDGQFEDPVAISAAASGTVYVADNRHDRIQYFSSTGDYQGQWGSSGTGNGQFTEPMALDVASDGTVYVSDPSQRRVQRFTPTGAFVGSFASNGTEAPADTYPLGIAIDGAGDVYVSDAYGKVRRFNATGTLEASWGTRGVRPGELQRPFNVTVPPGGTGSVYVAEGILQQEGSEYRGQAFTPDGGSLGIFFDEGPGAGQVEGLAGMTMDCGGKLYVADPYGREIELFSEADAPGCGITVNHRGDAADANISDRRCDADASAGGEQCTLRAAIAEANQRPGPDTIGFAISGAGVPVITPASGLPASTQPVTILGDSQPGGRVALRGEDAGAAADGLVLAGGQSLVKGLAVGGFGGSAVRIAGGGQNAVRGNLLGVDADGASRPNGVGVDIEGSPGTAIGGSAAGDENVISGNARDGVSIVGAGAGGTLLLGNLIGTTPAGDARRGNGGSGVRILDAPRTRIGGPGAGDGNLISGNSGAGVEVIVGSSGLGTTIEGNVVGIDREAGAGGLTLSNGREGIVVHQGPDSPSSTRIAGNVVSGNELDGIAVTGVTGVAIEGNAIGTDRSATSTLPLGNLASGIRLSDATDTVVGGTAAGQGNVLGTNALDGIVLAGGTTGTRIEANRLIAPNGNGVLIADTAHANTIGGTDPPAANEITDSALRGVLVVGGATANRVLGNRITGSGAEGQPVNLAIDLAADADRGPNVDDFGDIDAGGNGLQNAPRLLLASRAGEGLRVAGDLVTRARTVLRIEVFRATACDASGHGELEELVGSFDVMTDIDGRVTFDETLARSVSGGVVSATATGPEGTSEVSGCAPVGDPVLPGPGPVALVPPAPVGPAAPAVPVRVDRTPTLSGSRSLRVTKGVAKLALTCAAPSDTCVGTASLTAAARARASATSRLGSVRYSIPAGTRRSVRIKLTRGARSRLAKARVRARLSLKETRGPKRTFTVTLRRR